MQLRGSLDRLERSVVSGWAAILDGDSEKVTLDLLLGNRVIAQISADKFRQDLKDSGFGDGCFGFEHKLPADLTDEEFAAVRLRFTSSALFLERGTQTNAAPASGFVSKFGGLWIDRSDWLDGLAEKHRRTELSDDLADQIFHFVRDGYVVLKRAVPGEAVDLINADIERIWVDPPSESRIETFEPDRQMKVVLPSVAYREGTTKLLDAFAFSTAARSGIANPAAMAFLSAIFEDKPKAFQSLNFWNGSQQAMHKDSAYVRVDGNPLALAATWLALEDLEEGIGELEYYVGSHRAPDFVFGDGHKWMAGSDYDHFHQHDDFLRSLHEDAKRLGHARKSFVAAKGDLLVWHADLAHGGSPVVKHGRTRRSLVTHYCPASLNPYYRRSTGFAPIETPECVFVSQFVDVR